MRQFIFVSFRKPFVLLAFVAAVCFSQDITISGTVKDSSGAPIAGAEVKLEKENKSVTTNSQGKFSFDQTGINSNCNSLQNKKLSAHLRDNVLFVNIFEKGPVEITAHALNGQIVFSMQKVMDIGSHDISLPTRGNDMKIYRIKTGKREMILKSISGVSGSSSVSLPGNVTIDRTAKSYAINDILTVIKEGKVDWQVEVWKADTTLEISMLNCAETVTDASGNVYQSVRIGSQIWATGNLKTKKYNDGTDIPNVSDNNKWKGLSTPGWCSYENKNENGEIGLLYNWFAASHPKIAPIGWHVPTRDEQLKLRTYMISAGFNYDGTKYDNWNGKETDEQNGIGKAMASRILWKITKKPESEKKGFGEKGVVWNGKHLNNKSGLNILPCGSRWEDATWHQFLESDYTWSRVEANSERGWHTSLHTWQRFYGDNSHPKKYGFGILFLKD